MHRIVSEEINDDGAEKTLQGSCKPGTMILSPSFPQHLLLQFHCVPTTRSHRFGDCFSMCCYRSKLLARAA